LGWAVGIGQMGGGFVRGTATVSEFVKREIMQRTGISDASFVNLYDAKKEKFENIKKHRIKTFNVESLSSLAEKVLEQAKLNGGQRVLVVVNTVPRVQELYEELRSSVDQNVELLLLHSRFTVSDRQSLEAQIQKSFKNPKRSPDGAKILVATQVVEASLDIDADVLFTELAPLDALVQRMGRALRRIGPQFDSLGDGLYRAPNGEEYRIVTDAPNVYLFCLKDTVKRSPYSVVSVELLLSSILVFNGLLEGRSEEEIQQEIVSFTNKKGKKSLELKEGEFLLSEYKKYRLVCFFYRVMEEAGTEYIRAFFNTLSILDAGYVSSRKSEAQRIFRKIADVSAVPESLMDSFCRDVVNFVSGNCEEKKSFTHFKRDVLSKYVVSVPWAVAKDAVMRGDGVFNKLLNMLPASEQDLLSEYPLRSWLSNIFVVPGNYSNLGFVEAKTGKVDDANIL
ncbi:MAG: CRISPR-associated helicase Cas3', partial [Candidatus Atribacteria bacterium]|nr:CRISPR-associated helicase Cas3' [Candidatus Atribacteria bacterium]MCD6349363.1 CRISPR-associated helicase Cas3' [Candidatus Atribacteria bacterium]